MEFHAKDISKVFKFIAPGFVVVCFILKWLSIFHVDNPDEIFKVGAFIYAAGAGSIDLNLLVRNIRGDDSPRRGDDSYKRGDDK